MSAVDVAELWGGKSQYAGKSLEHLGVSSSGSKLDREILSLIGNQHSQTRVFNFSWPRADLTSTKANPEPPKTRNHDTEV